MKKLWVSLFLLNGCANIAHLIGIPRGGIYYGGARAKRDLLIRGDERKFIMKHGPPMAYRWDLYPTHKGTNTDYWLLDWGNYWALNLFYGGKTYVFTNHVYRGVRETQAWEYGQMHGYFDSRPWRISDYNQFPPKFYYIEPAP